MAWSCCGEYFFDLSVDVIFGLSAGTVSGPDEGREDGLGEMILDSLASSKGGGRVLFSKQGTSPFKL
jgi:hypothetical protein